MKNVVGEVFEGVVVQKDNNGYLVDLGIGIDTILLNEEVIGEVALNDEVTVIVTHYNRDDYFVSMKGVKKREALKELNDNIDSKQKVRGKVVDYRFSRFLVELDNQITGSVYVRNMDIKFIEDPNGYLNQEFDFIVTGRNTRGAGDFELDRRSLLQEEMDSKREDFANNYKVDDVVTGKVVSSNNFGLNLDVNGISCFVPRSEIAHYHLDEMPEVGSQFEVKITEIQPRNLSLKGSIKVLLAHPFDSISNLSVDTIVKGKITRKLDYGMFVEIADHVEGLVHISEVSYEHIKNLDQYEVGQEIDVKIIEIKLDKKRISLSIKRLLPSPYELLKVKVQVGDYLNVVIKRITESGVRVKLMDDYYTTIINEDIHDFSKIKPTLRINDTLETIVMELDDEKERVVLSNEEYVKKQYELFEENI